MLSNQMRGRAIRRCKTDPAKVANIWHLASIVRHDYHARLFSELDFSDYYTLQRRFQSFVGIAYTQNLIQNGMERLEIVNKQALQKEHEQINQSMYTQARNRAGTRRRWEETLAQYGGEDIKIVNNLQIRAKKEARFKSLSIRDLQGHFWILLIQTLFIILDLRYEFDLGLTISLILNVFHLFFLARLVGRFNPVRNMQKVGRATLSALQAINAIQTPKGQVSSHTSKSRSINPDEPNIYTIRLQGATAYENNIFIRCIQEIYQRIDNPRYLIQVRNPVRTVYFSVPSLLSNNKTNAEIMQKYWKKHIGRGNLIFTRNAAGRKALLNARKGSFDYKDEFFERKQLTSFHS